MLPIEKTIIRLQEELKNDPSNEGIKRRLKTAKKILSRLQDQVTFSDFCTEEDQKVFTQEVLNRTCNL